MDAGDERLNPLSLRAFELCAMSLPHGPNFGDLEFTSAWASARYNHVGAIFRSPNGVFTIVALRRRLDHCFVVKAHGGSFSTKEEAFSELNNILALGSPPEPLRSGERRRPNIFQLDARTPCDAFRLLLDTPAHWAAACTVAEIYFSLPKPDNNFASDMQTANFDSRLWELYLFACFREQGIMVSQDTPSPDFKLTSGVLQGYVEAVTANPVEPRPAGLPSIRLPPNNKADRMAGDAAARFARTLRSKLQRSYHDLPHVHGLPFAIALADFHGGGTMTWSREALITYLYGFMAIIEENETGPHAKLEAIETLRGHSNIKAGLFDDLESSGVSAVIFSNAATISKFNRMGLLAGLGVPGIKMYRSGILFDRTIGALEPIDFKLDVESSEYASLWPWGEAWCLELEVFHNPNATHPFPFELLPGATHWFEQNGEIICQSFWKHTVLSSVTNVQVPKVLERWPT
ncbi:TPA: hypothetical protein RVR74_000457 [Aeromonas salmonicida]|nr:hypothetical protein [Aeromonas salmonicida]